MPATPPRGLESLIGGGHRSKFVSKLRLQPRRKPLPLPLPVSKLPTAAKLAVESTVILSGVVLMTAWITQKVVQFMSKRNNKHGNKIKMNQGFEEGLMAFESFNWGGL